MDANGPVSTVVVRRSQGGDAAPVIVQRTDEVAPTIQRGSKERHTTTNTSALVGIAVGIAVLALGLGLVIRETPLLPYPLSLFTIVIVGIGLIAVGASLISSRTTTG